MAKIKVPTEEELRAILSRHSMDAVCGIVSHIVTEIVGRNEPLAAELCDYIDTLRYRNGLKRTECVRICSEMVGQDGKKGGKWTDEQVRGWLRKSGKPEEVLGEYNLQALVCAMNMMWSDHTELVKWIVSETGKMDDEEVCYGLAHDVLMDCDGAFDIRRYFKLD